MNSSRELEEEWGDSCFFESFFGHGFLSMVFRNWGLGLIFCWALFWMDWIGFGLERDGLEDWIGLEE